MAVNEDQIFGTGWFYENGDFVIMNDGNVKLSVDRERAVHGIQVLMATLRGEDFFHPGTGFDFLSVIQNESRLTHDEQIEFARMMIQQAILQDDRVQVISELKYNEEESGQRNKVFDVVVTLFNEEDISVQLTVSI
jgi:hypothetical protein